jgi:hypothetical protein
VERQAPFLATDKIGPEEFAFLFVPVGSPSRGVAVFSGPKNLWERFQSARSTILAAVGTISENGAQVSRKVAIPLVRARGVSQTAGLCADHLSSLLGAKRVSILDIGGKEPRLLACSGASSIDRHSPEVAMILSNFMALGNDATTSNLFGGPFSKWCADPEAASLGVLVEEAAHPESVDGVLYIEAGLMAHAIESKRHPLTAWLFPPGTIEDARRRKHLVFRTALFAGLACLAAILLFPVPASFLVLASWFPRGAHRLLLRFRGVSKPFLPRKERWFQRGCRFSKLTTPLYAPSLTSPSSSEEKPRPRCGFAKVMAICKRFAPQDSENNASARKSQSSAAISPVRVSCLRSTGSC